MEVEISIVNVQISVNLAGITMCVVLDFDPNSNMYMDPGFLCCSQHNSKSRGRILINFGGQL